MRAVFRIVLLLPFLAAMTVQGKIVKSTMPSSTQASTTAPATTQSTTQVSAFPTPAELIEKMRKMKKDKSVLPHVAYIDLSQRIVEKPASFSLFGDPDATTLHTILERLHEAKQDKDVRAVLITLGAGSAMSFAQAQELRDALAEINKVGKKTFVYADAYDTAGYTVATGATHVCMLEGGEIMIPGVGMEAMFAKGLLDRVGVKADYVQIGEYKGADEQYTRTGPSEQLKGEMTKLANSLYDQIVDGISLNRNLPRSTVEQIVDEAMFNGAAAKDRGLVDDLTSQDQLRELIGKELGAKEIELVHDYGKAQREAPDLSNPFSILMSMSHRPEPTGKPQVALVYLDGVITDGPSTESMFGGGSAGSDDLRKSLRIAARDENVKAVVIRIDSPGGSALASEVIWQAARAVAEKKPLIVSIGGMAASGGYYVASAADTIYADPGAIVGSIGVVGGKFVWHELADKLGVATESFSKGRNANLFSSQQVFDERQRKMVTGWMKQTYDQFIARILTTRKNQIKHIDDVARGRIFAAKQGKDIGLVDEIGGMQAAIAAAAEDADLSEGEYDVRVLPQPKTLADMFTGGGADAATAIRPRVSISVDGLFDAIDPALRRALAQQAMALQLLQQRPVMLVSPVIVTIR